MRGDRSSGGQDDRGRPPERRAPLSFWPSATVYLVVLALLALLAIAFVEATTYAYERIGLGPGWLLAVLVGSVVGSRFNIPVFRFRDRPERVDVDVTAFGMRWRVPVLAHTGSTILAVNVGGALIPGTVGIYLVVHSAFWLRALVATVVVAAVVFAVARPVRGVGIVTPLLVPPVTAAVVASLIGGAHVAALAYVAGTFGTLIGADVVNIGRVRRLGAPVASIGGAGTFDGIFLTGILAVLLAA